MDIKLNTKSKFRWYLPDNALNKSPGWNTFRVHVRDRFPTFSDKKIPMCVINDVLQEYGGKYSAEPRISWVDFNSEKRYMLFILKFGELK
tara:strand:+ start:385 stop:654 length:270 start_codon:yes stop_codon:yes gene_type:complete